MEDSDTDIESDNDNYSYKKISVVNMTLLSTLGWTPNLLTQIRNAQWVKAIFFFFLFLLDLGDAVFDFILSIKKMLEGEIGFGIFLFIVTILGRIVSGLYGYSEGKGHAPVEAAFVRFAIMEVAVFFLEDGAAVIVLANTTGEFDLIETISMYLTIVCGLCYMMYFTLGFWSILCTEGMDCNRVRMLYFIGGSTVFQTYFLITQVVLREDEDVPLSGGIEKSAFAVYGINVIFWGGLAVATFYHRL